VDTEKVLFIGPPIDLLGERTQDFQLRRQKTLPKGGEKKPSGKGWELRKRGKGGARNKIQEGVR